MDDDALIPVSALQHYVYCPRQCALIHVEQVWEDSLHTLEGTDLHERVEELTTGMRQGVRYETAVTVWSDALGLIGRCDLVELREEGPYPVEYKRGSAKAPQADAVQLCAQALCLEEMLGETCRAGAVYRAQSRSRDEVAFTDVLRARTREVIGDVREMLSVAAMPPPAADQRCEQCSLAPVCIPHALADTAARAHHHRSLYSPKGGER